MKILKRNEEQANECKNPFAKQTPKSESIMKYFGRVVVGAGIILALTCSNPVYADSENTDQTTVVKTDKGQKQKKEKKQKKGKHKEQNQGSKKSDINENGNQINPEDSSYQEQINESEQPIQPKYPQLRTTTGTKGR